MPFVSLVQSKGCVNPASGYVLLYAEGAIFTKHVIRVSPNTLITLFLGS